MRKGFTRKPQPDAPATLTKNYITPSGLQRLKDEHRFLLSRERRAGPPSAPSLNLGCPTLCGFQRVGTTDVGILRLLPLHHPLSSGAGWPTLGVITKPRLPHPLRFSKGGYRGCRHLEIAPLTSSSQLGHRENLVVQSVGFPSFRKERERMGQPQLVVAQKGRPAPCGRSMGFGTDETLLTKSANAGRRG